MKMNGTGWLQPFFLKLCYIGMLLLSLISLGCAKDEVKPSEDSVLAQNALRSIEQIKAAYETKDLASVANLIDSGLYRGIEKELNFEKAALSFSTPRIITISSSRVTMSVNWQGTWELQGVKRQNRGSSRFAFLKDSMQLVEIDGDNPFAVPASPMQ